MLRHWADHITTQTNDEVRVELHDSSFGGTATKLKGTGSGWFSHTPQKLDPREPLKNPIIKTEVKASLWVTDATLITDIFTAQEGRFTLIYDKNSVQEFEGYVLPDLCTKTQLESSLWRLDIVAKDLSILEGETYTLQTGRDTPIGIIADILSNKFSLNIVTHTSWIVDGTTTANDFMRQVYIDTFALRTYARTGDESDEAFTLIQALTFVLQSCGAILRQAEGKFYIQQLTAFDDPTSVLESNYDSAGAFVSASNVDLTTTAKIVISPENGNPGIKSARLKYDHRTAVSGITLPEEIELADSTTETFTQLFIGDGTQTIDISFDVRAETDIDESSMDARFRILIDTYYLQDDGSWDTTVNSYYEVSLTKGKPLVGGGNVWRGSFSTRTDAIPNAADGTLTLQFAGATGSTDFADTTLYISPSFQINNPVANENSTSIDYILTQSGNQSVRVDYGSIIFGDGPTGYSRGAITTDSAGNTLTSDDWARRGEVTFVNHAQIVLREILDVQRTFRDRFSATVKSTLSYIDIVSRDSKYFYNLGGAYDGYTGVMSPELLEIDIATGSDTFEDLPKFRADESSGTSGTSSGGGGGGLDQTTADDRYLNESENGADIPDVPTFRNNINLGSAQAVTFGSATLSNLTSGRVATVGTSGLLQDSANLTFDGTNLALASATFGANNALTGTLGDARYGQLGAANTWTAGNVFTALIQINNTGQEQLRLKGGSGDPFLSFWNADTNRLGFIQYNNTEGNMKFASERGGIDFLTGTGGTEVLALSLTSDQNAEFSGDVEKNDFSTGVTDFSGTGWQGTSGGDFNIRNLIVRESARFRELIIDQLSIIAGSDLLSVARGKIESIDTGANTVTIEDPNNRGATRFVANDFFWVKSVDIDNSTIIDLKGQVTAVSGTTLTLDTTVAGGTHAGGTTDISSLSVGDVIAQRGHPTNADRQSLIYRTVSDSDAPVEKFLDGIDSLGAFDTTSNIVVEIGPTSGHFGANNILTYSPNSVTMSGFTADNDSLYRTEGSIEITMGSPEQYVTSALGFHVGSDANNRIFMGELAGNYEIFANNAGNILFRLGSNENRIAGSYFDSTDLWGGSATKANATVRLDFANGQIYFDALSNVLYARSEVASFASGGTISGIQDQEWVTEVNPGRNENLNNEEEKIRVRFVKRFGEEFAIFNFFASDFLSISQGTFSYNSEIRFKIKNVSGTVVASQSETIGSNSGTTVDRAKSYGSERTISIDISALTDDTYYYVEITSFVESANVSGNVGDSAQSITYLREDVLVKTSTTDQA